MFLGGVLDVENGGLGGFVVSGCVIVETGLQIRNAYVLLMSAGQSWVSHRIPARKLRFKVTYILAIGVFRTPLSGLAPI